MGDRWRVGRAPWRAPGSALQSASGPCHARRSPRPVGQRQLRTSLRLPAAPDAEAGESLLRRLDRPPGKGWAPPPPPLDPGTTTAWVEAAPARLLTPALGGGPPPATAKPRIPGATAKPAALGRAAAAPATPERQDPAQRRRIMAAGTLPLRPTAPAVARARATGKAAGVATARRLAASTRRPAAERRLPGVSSRPGRDSRRPATGYQPERLNWR